MNSKKVRYFLSISDKIDDEAFMVVFSVFSLEKRGYHLNFLLLEGVCPLSDYYLHLGGVCLLEDCYALGFYPFVG